VPEKELLCNLNETLLPACRRLPYCMQTLPTGNGITMMDVRISRASENGSSYVYTWRPFVVAPSVSVAQVGVLRKHRDFTSAEFGAQVARKTSVAQLNVKSDLFLVYSTRNGMQYEANVFF
jgi:hypothetical protein